MRVLVSALVLASSSLLCTDGKREISELEINKRTLVLERSLQVLRKGNLTRKQTFEEVAAAAIPSNWQKAIKASQDAATKKAAAFQKEQEQKLMQEVQEIRGVLEEFYGKIAPYNLYLRCADKDKPAEMAGKCEGRQQKGAWKNGMLGRARVLLQAYDFLKKKEISFIQDVPSAKSPMDKIIKDVTRNANAATETLVTRLVETQPMEKTKALEIIKEIKAQEKAKAAESLQEIEKGVSKNKQAKSVLQVEMDDFSDSLSEMETPLEVALIEIQAESLQKNNDWKEAIAGCKTEAEARAKAMQAEEQKRLLDRITEIQGVLEEFWKKLGPYNTFLHCQEPHLKDPETGESRNPECNTPENSCADEGKCVGKMLKGIRTLLTMHKTFLEEMRKFEEEVPASKQPMEAVIEEVRGHANGATKTLQDRLGDSLHYDKDKIWSILKRVKGEALSGKYKNRQAKTIRCMSKVGQGNDSNQDSEDIIDDLESSGPCEFSPSTNSSADTSEEDEE